MRCRATLILEGEEMYFATLNGPIQVGGRGIYAMKTIDPYVDAQDKIAAFLRKMAVAAGRWYRMRRG